MGVASRQRRRPVWAAWAYDLARDLVLVWPWLAGMPLPQVAATLGTRYGPRWSATEVVDWVRHTRHGRDLPADVHSPLALLRQVSDDALTGPAQPPYPARRTQEHHHAQLTAQRAAQAAQQAAVRAATAAVRAGHTEQAATAAAAHTAGGGLAALHAARAALRERQAAAQAAARDRAARHARIEAALTDDHTWPEVRQPGAGR